MKIGAQQLYAKKKEDLRVDCQIPLVRYLQRKIRNHNVLNL